MLEAPTAPKKGSSSDGGIMRLRKPVCRTAHTTSSRMTPWRQPYPDVPKEPMRSNNAAWASQRRPNTPVIHPGGSPVFTRSSRAAGSSLWSAKPVPLAKKATMREWHRPARQRFAHKRHEASAPPSAAFAEAARALADRRCFRRRALRDVPAGSSPASIW
eukprot:jgi/Tetstr1/453315/TSEL_040306.t1